jgi:DNA polymerase-3 subunit delta
VFASLWGHYQRMLRLDGSGARSEAEAAALLNMKGSTYPAKKALTQARKLGHDGIRRAVELLQTADLDLRGVRDVPDVVILEVLVARLARLSR